MFKPRGCLSFQKHFHRNELWVVFGKGTAINDIKVRQMRGVSLAVVKKDSLHTFLNRGKAVIFEVQWGDKISEDDIERFAQ